MRLIVPLFLLLAMIVPINANDGVILLHGLCRTTRSMKAMEQALGHAGFTVVNVSYPSRSASIETLAELAIGNVIDSPPLLSCGRIHFVTHSLGSILVRSYFKNHEGNRAGRVVMLGPPNQGSEVVDRLGSWALFRKINGPAGLELGTGLHSAPSKLGPVNFELGVIAGNRSINWINSLMIVGANDGKVSVERTKVAGMKSHITIPCAHPFLMTNRTAIAEAIHFLQTASFSTGN